MPPTQSHFLCPYRYCLLQHARGWKPSSAWRHGKEPWNKCVWQEDTAPPSISWVSHAQSGDTKFPFSPAGLVCGCPAHVPQYGKPWRWSQVIQGVFRVIILIFLVVLLSLILKVGVSSLPRIYQCTRQGIWCLEKCWLYCVSLFSQGQGDQCQGQSTK